MSQKSQWEVVCIRCDRKDILNHEPENGYVCHVCGVIPEPIKYSKNEVQKIFVRPRGWQCQKHNNTFRNNEPCPECDKEILSPNTELLMRGRLERESKNIKDEIETNKVERPIRKKILEHEIALREAQLETPNLLKQQLKQQGEMFNQQSKRDELILKTLEKLIKIMGDKHEAQS